MISRDITITTKGQNIINAVKSVACEFVEHKQEDFFIIGQKRGINFHSQLIIMVDGTAKINPNKVYNTITIKEHIWGGLVWEIKEDERAVRDEIDRFTEILSKKLKEASPSI